MAVKFMAHKQLLPSPPLHVQLAVLDRKISPFFDQHADTLGHWFLISPHLISWSFLPCPALSSCRPENSAQTMFSVFRLSIPISATELLLASTVFCLVLWVVRAWQPRAPKGLKSPPGPWGWPLLGNVLTLGKSPHLALSRLSQRYGDVLQIRIGSTPVLVLSGLDTIQQALVQQGDDFKGRPDLYSFTLVTDGQSMTFNPDSGPVWAARRRLAQNALKSFSTASNPASASSCYLEEHVSKEAEALLSRLQEQMAEAGRFDPYNHVLLSVANVIGAMCFGQHFPQSSEEMLTLIKHSNDFVEIASSGNPVDFFPILQYMPSPALQRFKAFNQKLLRFLQKIVQEHYRDFDEVSPGCWW